MKKSQEVEGMIIGYTSWTCMEQPFSPCSIWYLSAFTRRAGQVTGGVFIMLGGSKHLNSAYPGPTVSDIGKVPLQRALQVTVSDFPDRSDAVLQPIR